MKTPRITALLMGLVLCLLASIAIAATTTIVGVGTALNGATVVLTDTTGASVCPYGQAFTDSDGRSGCWSTNTPYSQVTLLYRRPVAGVANVPNSNFVFCAPGTTTVEQCTSAQ